MLWNHVKFLETIKTTYPILIRSFIYKWRILDNQNTIHTKYSKLVKLFIYLKFWSLNALHSLWIMALNAQVIKYCYYLALTLLKQILCCSSNYVSKYMVMFFTFSFKFTNIVLHLNHMKYTLHLESFLNMICYFISFFFSYIQLSKFATIFLDFKVLKYNNKNSRILIGKISIWA